MQRAGSHGRHAMRQGSRSFDARLRQRPVPPRSTTPGPHPMRAAPGSPSVPGSAAIHASLPGSAAMPSTPACPDPAMMARVQASAQQRAAMIHAGDARLAELTDRLARLEALLDEVGDDRRRRQTCGGHWTWPPQAQAHAQVQAQAQAQVHLRMQAHHAQAHAQAATHAAAQAQAHAYAHEVAQSAYVHGYAVPRLPGAPGRFIEMPMSSPAPTSRTPPVPVGILSPGVPPPLIRRQLSGSWPSSPPPLSQLSFTPRACGPGRGTPRSSWADSRFAGGGAHRAFSAPRPRSMPVPPTPGPVGIWSMHSEDSAESKIRRWLQTIPIGDGAERGWDESQIAEIAGFAQGRNLEHLSAEEIYKRYVEYQVECAEG